MYPLICHFLIDPWKLMIYLNNILEEVALFILSDIIPCLLNDILITIILISLKNFKINIKIKTCRHVPKSEFSNLISRNSLSIGTALNRGNSIRSREAWNIQKWIGEMRGAFNYEVMKCMKLWWSHSFL